MAGEATGVIRAAQRGRPGVPGIDRLAWFIPNRPGIREGLHAICRRRDVAGSQDLNQASWTSVNFATEDLRSADYFDAVGSFPSQIRILAGGTYRIEYVLNVALTGITAVNFATRIRINDSSVATGGQARWFAGIANQEESCYGLGVLDLAAGDYVELETQRVSGTATTSSIGGQSTLQVSLLSDSDDPAPGGRVRSEVEGKIEYAVLSQGVGGTSGQTKIDVLRNGSSVLTPSTLLAIDATDDVQVFDWRAFTQTAVAKGDVWTLAIEQQATPPVRDLRLELWVRRT